MASQGRTIKPSSSPIDDAGVRAVFQQMDTDQDGKISANEFRSGLLDSGLSQGQIDTLFKKLDLDSSSELDLEEFTTGYKHLPDVLQRPQAAQAWSVLKERDTCSLYHAGAGTVIEFNKMPGAWFHFLEKRKGRGKMLGENAAVKNDRQLRSDGAIVKLEKGEGKILIPGWEWEGWKLLNCPPQIALYRPKHAASVPLLDVVHFVDPVLWTMGEVKIGPLLVLDADGFSFIGVKGHCVSVRGGTNLQKHGLITQVCSLSELSACCILDIA